MKGPSWADQTEEEEQRRDTQPTQTTQRQQQSAYPSRAAPSSSSLSGDVRGAGGGPRVDREPQRSNQDFRGPASAGRTAYGGGGRDNRGPQSQQGGYGGRPNQPMRDEGQWQRGEQPPPRGFDDRRGGVGGSFSQQRSDPRDNRGGPRGGPSRSSVPDTPRETGIVAVLKDGFGFLRCADREGEVFFHFSDFPASQSNPPRKGDEVSFRVTVDQRDQRARASFLELLPKGTVVFEAIVAECVRGVIVREMRGQLTPAAARKMGKRMSLADSLAQGRAEAYGGKIKRIDVDASAAATDAAAAATDAAPSADETYEFSERDLDDPNILLFEGDVIEFNIFVEKKSNRRGATKVTLVEPNPVGRERGKVVTVKDGFGFLTVEQEVDEDEEDAAPTQQSNRFDRSHGGGRDRDQLFFHFSEMIDPSHAPAVGDEYSFRIDRSPAEGNKVSAQRIQVLPRGSLNSREVGRESLQGTVTKEISFETAQASAAPAAAAAAATPAAAATTDAAVDATAAALAEVAVTPAAAAPSDAQPPLATASAAAASSSRAAPRKVIPGIITYTDASGASIELSFRPSDIQSDRRATPLLLTGDTVSFRTLTFTRRSGVTTRATQIQVQPAGWSKLNREQGIVSQVREGFAFVDAVSRSDKIFLHSSQLRVGSGSAPNPSLSVGLEVEFNIAQEVPGRFSAVRAVTLPAGSVQFEETLPMTLTARVTRGIKHREANRNVPKAGTDSASFSKNDLRRDQAAQQARGETQSRGEGRGEKGEVKSLALMDGSEPLPADFNLPSSLAFFDVNVMEPLAGLDASALVVGDTVTLQLQRHKRTNKLSATKVQLTAISRDGREAGQVIRIKGAQGLGFLATASRLAPIAFFLRDAPAGAKVAVGDCFEFNISEANAGGKREQRAGAAADDHAHAVRLTALPRGSVEVEKVDRATRMRGYISVVPDRPDRSNKQAGNKPTAGNKQGQVVRLTGAPREEAPLSTTLASMWTHPAAWPLQSVESTSITEYSATLVHPGAIVIESRPVQEERFAFSFSDVSGNVFLSKGDLLDFFVSERTQPAVSKRAIEVTLAPLQGTVERVDFAAGSDQAPRAYTGLISVFNPQAQHSEETFVFSSKDYTPPPTSSPSPPLDASSVSPSPSPSPPPPAELAVGDTVEFTEIVLNSEKKKRQAKQIIRIKAASRSIVRPGTRRAPGAAIVYATRFARGPDKVGIGFSQPRASQVAAAAAAAAAAAEAPAS